MKSLFFAFVLAAVIVALMVRVWWGIIEVLNDLTGQPGEQYDK
jgi:hypothetical protein